MAMLLKRAQLYNRTLALYVHCKEISFDSLEKFALDTIPYKYCNTEQAIHNLMINENREVQKVLTFFKNSSCIVLFTFCLHFSYVHSFSWWIMFIPIMCGDFYVQWRRTEYSAWATIHNLVRNSARLSRSIKLKLEKHFVNCDDFSCEVLLILASQRIEDVIGWELKTDSTKRGSPPSLVESCILAWVAGWYQ
jgi:hypothetical protein